MNTYDIYILNPYQVLGGKVILRRASIVDTSGRNMKLLESMKKNYPLHIKIFGKHQKEVQKNRRIRPLIKISVVILTQPCAHMYGHAQMHAHI